MTLNQFTLFTQLDTNLQGEIVGFLDWFDWGMMRLVNKAMYKVCDAHKVKKEVFGPNMYFEMILPKEYAWMEETTKGVPLSTCSLDYEKYPHFVIGYAYNPFGNELWGNRWVWDDWKIDGDLSVLPKQYFAMCVNAETYGDEEHFRGFHLMDEEPTIGIDTQPNTDYRWNKYYQQRCWEKWDFQYMSMGDVFIPCEMWTMRLEFLLQYQDEIVHFFPSFEGVALIHTTKDLLALYERVIELPSF